MASPFPRPDDPDAHVEAGPSRRWEARLFGDFRLVAPDGSDATPVGRKTRALVAYLMAATEAGATRDRIVGLLWGERGEDQARASLRQMLTTMRPLTAGDRPLVIVDRVRARIAAEHFRTDLQDLHALAARHDAVALATLIGEQPPDLLTDLDGIDPGFDEWLALERTRRADQRRSLVLGVAERALASKDVAAAAKLAGCLLRHDPTDEAAARLAMEAHGRQGDRDGVRRVFARLKSALRTECGADPTGETIDVHHRLSNAPTAGRDDAHDAHDAHETPPDASALPRASVEPIDHDGPSAPDVAVDPIPATTATVFTPAADLSTSPASHAAGRRKIFMTAWVAIIVVIAVGAALGLRSRAARVDPHVVRVDALRAPTGDAAGQAVGVGFPSALGRLVYAVDTTLDVIHDGQSTSVGHGMFAIDGEARSDGNLLHVDVRLRREGDGAALWSGTFSRPTVEVDALREQIVYRVAGVVICAAGRHNPKVDRFDLESLRLLFAACAAAGSDKNEAVEDLTKLLARQPDFAHGWAMLARATTSAASPEWSGADAACTAATPFVDRALALDSHDGLAYVVKSCAFNRLKSWPQRMAVLERGRAADPTDATVLAAIAASLVEIGRLDEAMPLARRIGVLDPFDAANIQLHAGLLAAHGESPEAQVVLQVARRRFPTDTNLAIADFRYNAMSGDTNRALALVVDPARGFHLMPTRAALWKAIIIARAAPSAAHDDEAYEALRTNGRVLEHSPDLLPDLLNVVMLSAIHRNDEAFASAAAIDMDRDQDWTGKLFTTLARPLRADPRFMTLAAHLGLLAIWQQTGKWPDFCSDRSIDYDCRVEAERARSGDPMPRVAK